VCVTVFATNALPTVRNRTAVHQTNCTYRQEFLPVASGIDHSLRMMTRRFSYFFSNKFSLRIGSDVVCPFERKGCSPTKEACCCCHCSRGYRLWMPTAESDHDATDQAAPQTTDSIQKERKMCALVERLTARVSTAMLQKKWKGQVGGGPWERRQTSPSRRLRSAELDVTNP